MADVPKTISLDFDGVFMKPGGLPAASGIYCVYACADKDENTVTIAKLVYIGESGNMRARVTNHPRSDDWKKHLAQGQVLCFTAASVTPESTRQRAEAALIFKHKPRVNAEYTKSFPFDTTTINASGKTVKLTTSFTVRKDATS
jgi:excinuclease UvrABC nuclease subunit